MLESTGFWDRPVIREGYPRSFGTKQAVAGLQGFHDAVRPPRGPFPQREPAEATIDLQRRHPYYQ
jgi:hypothetical protein